MSGIIAMNLAEFCHLKGHESTFFKLGQAYRDMGETEKALKAFEDCLTLGEGRHKQDQYPLKQAREAIARIKSQ